MSEPQNQTVVEAACEWLSTEEGMKAFSCARLANRRHTEYALELAFAAGVKWMANEVIETRRKAGSRH